MLTLPIEPLRLPTLLDVDRKYLQLVTKILLNGVPSNDRTGVGTISIFGERLEFDLQQKFPVVSVKKTNWKAATDEMAWMLRGERNTKTLNSKIWDDWQDADGDLGPIYGHQWRYWGQDQIKQLIKSLRENPSSRRHILSAWNHADVPEMSLAPCHMMAQFYVNQNDRTLSCMMTQRSCDVFLGLPFNIVGYAFLTHVLADICGYKVGKLVMSIGDTHIYANHLDAVETLLKQGLQPNPELNMPHLFHLKPIPKDWSDIPGDIDSYYKVIDYLPNKFIPAPVAV